MALSGGTLRLRHPWLTALAFLVIAILFYYIVIGIIGPRYALVCSRGTYGPPDHCEYWDTLTAYTLRLIVLADEHNGLVAAIAGLAVAGFTGVLWIVTGKAAEAGRAAAAALPVVERAYVYPVITNPGGIAQCLGSALVFHLDDDDGNKPCDITCEVSFQVKNFGKTPAVLTGVFVSIGMPPGNFLGQVIEEPILGSGDSTRTITAELPVGLTRNDAQSAFNFNKSVDFRGEITFNDIWNIRHITKFNFVWKPDVERWVLDALITTEQWH